jgi:exonuclease SbcC
MRIKEFVIHRYGPLAETGKVRLNTFNLFWGENEEGKTLTIEAVIKLLLSKTRKLMADIDRVKEEPEGFIIIENDEGGEDKIPEQGRISDLVNLSGEECANLFIIRNSDLSIARESEFYGSVTERLTGLRSSQIQKVKKNLRILGYLTESHHTVNTRESQYLSNRLTNAEELIRKCQELSKSAKTKDYDKLEQKLVSQKQELDFVNREIQKQEKARLRDKHEKGKEGLAKLVDAQSKLKSLHEYSEEKLIREEQEQIDQFRKRLATYQKEIDEGEKLVFDEKNELQVLQKKQTRMEETLKPIFRDHGILSQKLSINKISKRFFQVMLLVVSIILLLSFAGVIWKPSLVAYLLAGAFLIIFSGLSTVYFFKLIYPYRKLERCKQEIFYHAGEFGITGDGIPELQIEIQRFEESLLRQEQKVNALENQLNILSSKSLELRQEHLARSEQRLANAQQTVQEFKGKLGLANIDEFQRRLQERRQFERRVAESRSALKSLFGISEDAPGEQNKHWQNRIDELGEFEDEFPDAVFDERDLESKKIHRDKLASEISVAQGQLENYQKLLSEIEREAREVLLLEKNPYPCQNLADLAVVISKLKEFRQKIDDKQSTVLKALKILSEIEAEEVQKVGSLFGEDKPVSQYFQEITGSLYQEVHYDPNESTIQVKRQDGKTLSAKWLSGGAYDQLYFAIRLALGRELLQGQEGFFILDDPFIKADRNRLARMMDILVEISRQGWQVIYFSAKDEILDVLKKYVDSKEVTLHQVPKSKLLVGEDL